MRAADRVLIHICKHDPYHIAHGLAIPGWTRDCLEAVHQGRSAFGSMTSEETQHPPMPRSVLFMNRAAYYSLNKLNARKYRGNLLSLYILVR